MASDYPLIILSQAAYAGSVARAALDLALAQAVFGQQPRVLFQGAGVLQLRDTQEPATAGRKSLRKVIESFPMYDVERIYVAGESLARFRITPGELPAFAAILDGPGIATLRDGARLVLSL